jgi:hypothetical protein
MQDKDALHDRLEWQMRCAEIAIRNTWMLMEVLQREAEGGTGEQW